MAKVLVQYLKSIIIWPVTLIGKAFNKIKEITFFERNDRIKLLRQKTETNLGNEANGIETIIKAIV